MATPPPTPALTNEELAERELQALMSSDTPAGCGVDEDEPTGPDEEGPELPLAPTLTPRAIRRHERDVARRRATQLKLHPYQRDAVDEFVESSPAIQGIMIYTNMFALENQLTELKAAAPMWECSPQLLENIRSYVVAVLLSSKTSGYKLEAVPVGHVMTLLTMVARSYVPPDIKDDAYIMKTVRSIVQTELTQARAKVKKHVLASIKASDSIFDLATTLVGGTNTSVSVPLCSRLALLRRICVESPDAKYWDKVDARLTLIRSTAKGEARKITMALEAYLVTDRSIYGVGKVYMIAQDNGEYQKLVDGVLMGVEVHGLVP